MVKGKSPKAGSKRKAQAKEEPKVEDVEEPEEEPEEKEMEAEKVPTIVAQEYGEDQDEDDDAEEEDESPPVKKQKQGKSKVEKPVKAAKGKKVPEPVEEEDEENCEEEEDDTAEAPAKGEDNEDNEDNDDKNDDNEDKDVGDDDENGEDGDDDEAKKAVKKKAEEKQTEGGEKTPKYENKTLYVTGIPKKSSHEDVRNFFAECNANIKQISKEPRRKMCFVTFVDEEDLVLGLTMDGKIMGGHTIIVNRANYDPKKCTPDGERKEEDNFDEVDACVLVARNLAKSVTETHLREKFANLKSLRMPLNPDNRCRGFAFITFHSAKEASKTMRSNHGIYIEGQAVTLGPYRTIPFSKEAGKTKVLFVRNLCYETTEETIKEHFPDAHDVRLMTYSDSGRSKGYGFVEYETPEEAAAAFKKYEGVVIDGRSVSLDFAQERGASSGTQKASKGSGGGGGFGRNRDGGGGGGFKRRRDGGGGGRGGGFRHGGRGGGGGGRGGGGRGGRGGGFRGRGGGRGGFGRR